MFNQTQTKYSTDMRRCCAIVLFFIGELRAKPKIASCRPLHGGFRKFGVPFGGPYKKDYNILGVYWGPLIL